MALDLPRELITGHREVDAQHAAILAELGAMRAGDPARFPVSVAFLAQHVRSHFAYEERLMDDAGYPELAYHRAEHRRFAQFFASLRERAEREGPTRENVAALVDAVEVWIAEHVMGTDQRLAEFIRQARVA